MKFLCDRCKTRYSIGDDRVRGKILKIRCKNCANVITVREGMADPGPADSGPLRRKNPTTMSPTPSHTQSAPAARGNGALASAFASQMTKPPAALEEEWYVSIDGEQSGPFSLAEAQRWVAAKAYDADLHCWSEGFDDWLPVDKVSHFRGLRKKPAPAPAPPPLPRVAPRLAAVPAIEEETPKPLFAATMAALEKNASGSLRVPAVAPAVPSVVAPVSKTNGSGGAPMPVSAKGTASGPAVGPAVAKKIEPAPKTPARGITKPGVGAGTSPGAQALAAAFDVPAADEGDSLTAVEAPAFDDAMMRPAEAPRAASPPVPDPRSASEDDSLEIGEVSRVVNLADLARNSAPPRKTSRAPQLRTTASTPKFHPSEVMPAAGSSAAITNMTGPFMPLDMPVSEGVAARAPSKRGLILILVGAGVLLAGVLGAIVWIATSNDDNPQQVGLGRTRDIDTSRPEEIVQRIHDQATGTGSAAPIKPVRPRWNGPQIMKPGQTNGGPDEVTDPTKRELDASEVEEMAGKQGDGTNFCYKRAQRGALGLEIQDLKKMQVTLTVDKEGAVGDVQLSSHAADSFGVCLANRIKGWKFRQSSGAKTFKITLVFQAG